MALVGIASADEPKAPSPDLREIGNYTIEASQLTRDLGGGVTATLDAGTRLRIAAPTYIRLAPNKPATRCASIELLSGRIELHVPAGKPPANSAIVRTPVGVSALPLGGHSIVAASSKGGTVANVTGEVLAGEGTRWRHVRPGVANSFTSSGAVPARDIVGVPSVHVRDLLVMAPSGGDAATQVTVRGEHMTRFEVVVSPVGAQTQTAGKTFTTTGAPVTVTGLSPGRHQVIARGFDEWGLSKGHSSPVFIDVLAYDLPPGAKVSNGVVYLLPGQRIELHGSEKLEMTYGDQSQAFVPAPRDIGLGALPHQTARFRVNGSPNEGRLQMASRPFRASAAVQPKTTDFRNDLVQLSLRVTNSHGKPVEALNLKKRVTINRRHVKVKWRRDRGRLVANLPPQPGAGPWQVRVELDDRFGTFFTYSETLRPPGSGRGATSRK